MLDSPQQSTGATRTAPRKPAKFEPLARRSPSFCACNFVFWISREGFWRWRLYWGGWLDGGSYGEAFTACFHGLFWFFLRRRICLLMPAKFKPRRGLPYLFSLLISLNLEPDYFFLWYLCRKKFSLKSIMWHLSQADLGLRLKFFCFHFFFFFAILLALCKYPHLLQYFIVRFMVRLKISMYLFDCCVEKPLMAVTIQSLWLIHTFYKAKLHNANYYDLTTVCVSLT